MQAVRAPLMLPAMALWSADSNLCMAPAPLQLPPASLSLPVSSRRVSRSPASVRPAGGSPLALPMRSRGSRLRAHSGVRLPALPGRPRTTSDLDDEPEAPRHDRTAVMLLDEQDDDVQEPQLDQAAATEMVCGFEAVEVTGVECAICCDEHGPDASGWRKLACGHTFHQACLCELVKCSHRRKCPLCRAGL